MPRKGRTRAEVGDAHDDGRHSLLKASRTITKCAVSFGVVLE